LCFLSRTSTRGHIGYGPMRSQIRLRNSAHMLGTSDFGPVKKIGLQLLTVLLLRASDKCGHKFHLACVRVVAENQNPSGSCTYIQCSRCGQILGDKVLVPYMRDKCSIKIGRFLLERQIAHPPQRKLFPETCFLLHIFLLYFLFFLSSFMISLWMFPYKYSFFLFLSHFSLYFLLFYFLSQF
jgi:hypothetical protein